ncbi:MAG: inositol monophosphatase family protein [Pseudomonadota bacterium]
MPNTETGSKTPSDTDLNTTNLINQFVDTFLPQLIIAGNYARQLQGRLQSRPEAKSGDAWTSVLTDADLGVQRYLEAYTLAQVPDWYFYGEEHAQSDNTKYFDPAARIAIMLDPINGTRLYKDGADSYDILLSLRIDDRIVATISHMPAQQITYIADCYDGCRRIDHTGAAATSSSAINVGPSNNANMTLATYQTDALAALLPASVDNVNMLTDYAADDPRCCLNSIFEGQLGGYLFCDCALLDVGATAFAVTCAGGVATKPDGNPLDVFAHFDPERREDLLVCMNPKLHDVVSKAIRRGAD